MKKIIIPILAFFFLCTQGFGQASPVNITATTYNTGTGALSVTFAPGGCPKSAAANGAYFYVLGLFSHASPAPNGVSNEYDVNTFVGTTVPCNGSQRHVVSDGGTASGGGCMQPKNSTCYRTTLGRSTTLLYTGAQACALTNFALSLTGTSALCQGITYDVYVWEIFVASAAGGTNVTSATTLASVQNRINCGAGITAASVNEAVSNRFVLAVTGTLSTITAPTITVSGIVACPTGNGTYTSTHLTLPSTGAAPTCANVTDIMQAGSTLGGIAGTSTAQNGSNGNPTTPATNGPDIAGLINGGNVTSSAALSYTRPGTKGANVIEVNCRDNPSLVGSAPTGTCKGGFTLATPLCAGSPATSTFATVWTTVNGLPYLQNISNDGNASLCNAAAVQLTCGTDAVTTSNTYPNNYTDKYGSFTDGVCNTAFRNTGNPLPSGVNPFSLPGVTTFLDADGNAHQQSIVCIRAEDDCNGAKATNCVRFVSDVPAMAVGTVVAIDESCPGANDACITLSGLAGGFIDQNTSGATAAEVPVYTITSVPALTFATVGTTRKASAVPAGTYVITIADQSGGPCNRACNLTRTIVVNANVPDQALLASSAASICGGATANLTATLRECPTVPVAATIAGPTGAIDGTQACNATTGQGRTYTLTPPTGCRPSKIKSMSFTITNFTDPAFRLQDLWIVVDGVLLMKGNSYTGGTVTTPGTATTVTFNITDGAAPPATGYTIAQLGSPGATSNVTSPLNTGTITIYDANCNFGANATLTVTAFSGVYDTYTFSNAGVFLAADPTYTVVPACAGCLSVASGATASVFTAPAVTTCTTYRVTLAGKNASARTLCAGGTTNCDATTSFVDVVVSPKPTITATNLVCDATTDVITATGSGGSSYQYCLTGVTPAGCLPVLPPCNTTGSFTGLPNCVSGATLTIQNSAPVAPCLACPSSPLSFPSCILPVSFLSFDAKYETKKVVLNWLVTSETNIGSYEVQRSADNINFKTIANVAPQNGGSVTTSYFSVDENAVAGFNYYRIVIKDLDGKTDKTPVVRILVGDGKIDIISAMPNPTQGVLNYSVNVPQGTSANITIRDAKGKLVYKTLVVMGKGTNTYTYDAAQLAAGLYMLEATDAKSGARSNIKFVKE